MEEKTIHVRLDLEPGDPLWAKFVEIKKESGITSGTQVLRLLIRRYRLRRGENHNG